MYRLSAIKRLDSLQPTQQPISARYLSLLFAGSATNTGPRQQLSSYLFGLHAKGLSCAHCSKPNSRTNSRFFSSLNTIYAPAQKKSNESTSDALLNANKSSGNTKTCWSCGKRTSEPSIFCENAQCKAVQPVGKDTTYFDVLLDGQPSFDIDTSTLRRNFLKIQQLVHPDNFTQAPKDINRKHARVQSAWVNHAYTTLKDQLLRAHYLLELYNEGIGEDDQITDPEFLMEIMELRDEIEMAETDQQTAEIKVQNDAKIAEIVKRLSAAFGSKDYALAKQLTHHLQYLHRATQAIHDWEPGKPVTIPH